MTEAATLMFGVGATRAGTTWLYHYLAGHPDCALPRVKELQYFKVREHDGRKRQIRRMEKQLNRIDAIMQKAPEGELPSLRAWQRDLRGLHRLFAEEGGTQDYMDYLYDRPSARLYGDISPSYALLSEERLHKMSKLGENVKFVFLLRDPVDRLWSNMRQAARLKALKDVEDPSTDLVQQHVMRMFDRHMSGLERGIMVRSDYKGILSRFAKAFPREQLFVEFYERMFNDDTIARLCGFLNIGEHKADFGRRANVAVKMKMTPDQHARVQATLADQYDAVEEFMGELPERWQANRPASRVAEMKV